MITKDYTIFKLSAGQHIGRLASYFGNVRILGMNNFFDLAKKKMKALPIDYTSSWASYGKYVENDGKVIFAVSTEKDGNGYFRYDPKTNKAKKIAEAEQIPMWIVPLK